MWLLNPKIDKIGSIGYNGDTYIAYVGSGYIPDIDEFNEAVDAIKSTVDVDLLEHPDFYDWTIEERNYMAIREESYRIAMKFGWTLEGGRIYG